jgi:hypothetical protein
MMGCSVRSAPCEQETALFGGATLDGSSDEFEVYLAEVVDDSTRLTNIEWCRTTDVVHFRGWKATFETKDGVAVTHSYASPMVIPELTTPIECFSVPLPHDILYFTLYKDWNDIEGFIFEDYLGNTYTMRADGNSASPKFKMAGRPVGFRVWVGWGGGGYNTFN